MIRVSLLSLCIIVIGILGFFSIKYSYQKPHNSNITEFVEYNNTRFYCDGEKPYFLQGVRDFYVINSIPQPIIKYKRTYIETDLCKEK